MDLSEILDQLDVSVRDELYVYSLVSPGDAVVALAAATIREDEGLSVILAQSVADVSGLEYEFVCRWITLTVHSSLESVGLTAAFSRALADAGIACNVLAGSYHDHLLVPAGDCARAVEVLCSLRERRDVGG